MHSLIQSLTNIIPPTEDPINFETIIYEVVSFYKLLIQTTSKILLLVSILKIIILFYIFILLGTFQIIQLIQLLSVIINIPILVYYIHPQILHADKLNRDFNIDSLESKNLLNFILLYICDPIKYAQRVDNMTSKLNTSIKISKKSKFSTIVLKSKTIDSNPTRRSESANDEIKSWIIRGSKKKILDISIGNIQKYYLYFIFWQNYLAAYFLLIIEHQEIKLAQSILLIALMNLFTNLGLKADHLFMIPFIFVFSFALTAIEESKIFLIALSCMIIGRWVNVYGVCLLGDTFTEIRNLQIYKKIQESVKIGTHFYSPDPANVFYSEQAKKFIKIPDALLKSDQTIWYKNFLFNQDYTCFPLNQKSFKHLNGKNKEEEKYSKSQLTLRDIIIQEESDIIKDSAIRDSNSEKLIYLGCYSLGKDKNKIFEIYKTPYRSITSGVKHITKFKDPKKRTQSPSHEKSKCANFKTKNLRDISIVMSEVNYKRPSSPDIHSKLLVNKRLSNRIRSSFSNNNSFKIKLKCNSDNKLPSDNDKNANNSEYNSSITNLLKIRNSAIDDDRSDKLLMLQEEQTSESIDEGTSNNNEDLEKQEFAKNEKIMEEIIQDSECVFIIHDITKIINKLQKVSEQKFRNIINGKMAHEIKTPCIAINSYLGEVEKFMDKKLTKTKYSPLIKTISQTQALTDQILNVMIQMCDYHKEVITSDLMFEEVCVHEQIKWCYWLMTGIVDSNNNNKIRLKLVNNSIERQRSLSENPSGELLERLDYDELGNIYIRDKEELDEEKKFTLNTDLRRFRIVLAEAIKNSIKFTNSGSIFIIINEHNEDKIDLIIKDTGCGINKEKLSELQSMLSRVERKFLRFKNFGNYLMSDFTTNMSSFGFQGGLNLGLQLMKIYCLFLNIEMNIYSKISKGTSVKLTFQVTKQRGSAPANNLKNNVLHSLLSPVESKQILKGLQKKKFKNSDVSAKNPILPVYDILLKSLPSPKHEKDKQLDKCQLSLYHASPYANSSKKDSLNSLTKFKLIKDKPQSPDQLKSIGFDSNSSGEITVKEYDSNCELLNSQDQNVQESNELRSTVIEKVLFDEDKDKNSDLEYRFKLLNPSPVLSEYKREIQIGSSKTNKTVNITSELSQPLNIESDHNEQNKIPEGDKKEVKLKKKVTIQSVSKESRHTYKKDKPHSSTRNLALVRDSELLNFQGLRILITDDDYNCRKNLKNLLKNVLSNLPDNLGRNISVIKATDGIETVKIVIEDQLIGNSSIRLIISDENMAFVNGSDSFALLNKMFSMNKLNKIPLVILTALEDTDTLNQIKRNSGASDILKKPLGKKVLNETLLKYKDFLDY